MITKTDQPLNPWRVRVRDHRGIEHQRSFPTKRLAGEWEAEMKLRTKRQKTGLKVDRPDVTLPQLIDLYLEGYDRKSKDWLEYVLGHARKRWPHRYVRDLRPEEIQRWITKELQQGAKTRSHILTALRQVLAAGVEWGYLDQSPARPRAVRGPSLREDQPIIQPFESWEEVCSVASGMRKWGPLVRFVCSTGLRIEEWLALEWRDIDLDAQLLQVNRIYRHRYGLSNAAKTPGAHRPVVLSEPAIRALADQPRTSKLVFPGKQGYLNLHTWRQKTWPNGLERAGFTYRPPYQMRHTYATLALAQGVPIDWVSQQMGHTTVETTRRYYARYIKVFDDRMRDLLNAMEDTAEDLDEIAKPKAPGSA